MTYIRLALPAALFLFFPMLLAAQIPPQPVTVPDDSTESVESDSTDYEEADTTATEEDVEEPETPWSLNAKSEYEASTVKKGVAVSADKATMTTSAGISHASGLSAGASWAQLIGSTSEQLSLSANIDYSYSLTDWFGCSLGINHTKYANDSLSSISALQNSLQAGMTFSFDFISVGLSYEQYLGTEAARFIGGQATHEFTWNDLSVTPAFDLTYINQEIFVTRLAAVQKNLKKIQKIVSKTKLVKISGISSLSFSMVTHYNAGYGFGLYVYPAYVSTPKSQISAKSQQFIVSFGINYSHDF